MSRSRDQDCCEYREQKRKLARQKLRFKMEASNETKKKKRDDDCGDDEDEETEIGEERKCEERRAQKMEALSKLLSLGDEMMRRIKPSIDERDKYSMSYRHIRCFLEPGEIERMELEERMRSILKCMPCETIKREQQKFDKYQVTMPNKRKKKKRKKKKKKDKPNEVVDEEEKEGEEKAENKNDSATEDEEEADPQPEKEKEEPKKDEEKEKIEKEKRANKSEFWCREVKKKPKPKRDEKQFEIDCKDSICSFDSEYDLSGLALTKEDLKKIAEKRRNKMASKSKDKS